MKEMLNETISFSNIYKMFRSRFAPILPVLTTHKAVSQNNTLFVYTKNSFVQVE